MKRMILALAVFGGMLSLVACSGGGGPTAPPLPGSVHVSPANATVQVGAQANFTATGGTGSYQWSVSPANCGTIVPSAGAGRFTAGNAPGSCTVTAMAAGGGSGTAQVTVVPQAVNSAVLVSADPPNGSTIPLGTPINFTFQYTTAPGYAYMQCQLVGTGSVEGSDFVPVGSSGTITIRVHYVSTPGFTGPVDTLVVTFQQDPAHLQTISIPVSYTFTN